MKRIRWLAGALAFSFLAMALSGCGGARSDYKALEAEKAQMSADYQALEREKAELSSENDTLRSERAQLLSDNQDLLREKAQAASALEALRSEKAGLSRTLERLEEKYPPRNFRDIHELELWLKSDTTNGKNPDTSVAFAADLQRSALLDGYLVSLQLVTDQEGNARVINAAVAGDSLYAIDTGGFIRGTPDDFWLLANVSQEAAEPQPAPTPEEMLATSADRMNALGYFQFDLENAGGGTPIAMGLEMIRASGAVARPDRLKIKVTATAGATSLDVQLVTVGDTTYMTNPITAQWVPLPNQLTAVRLFNPDIGITAILGGIRGATSLPPEVLGDTPCYHLKGTLDSSILRPITAGLALDGRTIETEVWIGKADLLLRRVKLAGQIAEGENPGISRTLSISGFNEPISITLPEQTQG